MYTFVYRTFIKFILFCRGQALYVPELLFYLQDWCAVSMPSRAWVVTEEYLTFVRNVNVSMPSRAWVVTPRGTSLCWIAGCFNALSGLSCYLRWRSSCLHHPVVSMPSRAWVVTARMSNILNFLWYFLCIPAIYKCILAYLSIFFNQLSEFLRCESPSTFLGTCLSHHSFIILLVTSTSALLTGLYLISTEVFKLADYEQQEDVNALSGLYLISTL